MRGLLLMLVACLSVTVGMVTRGSAAPLTPAACATLALVAPTEDCCFGTRGNVNKSVAESPDLSDLSLLINYLTSPVSGRPTLPCFLEADLNADGILDLGDLSCFVARVTIFPAPPCLADCPLE